MNLDLLGVRVVGSNFAYVRVCKVKFAGDCMVSVGDCMSQVSSACSELHIAWRHLLNS